MPDRPPPPTTAPGPRPQHWPAWAALATLAAAFLTLPALAGTPERLIKGCGKWIVIAGVLELLSVLGFVVVFKLVFGARMSWRRSASASMRALGVAALLPGGGLIGPGSGAWSRGTEKRSLASLARSTITFVVLTQAPSVIVLGALGLMLWLGFASGPHVATLTLLPGALALGVITATWFVKPSSRRPWQCQRPMHTTHLSLQLAKTLGVLREGVTEAHRLLLARDWKLVGALAYYVFDNAVLWAAFHAYGPTPPLNVIVMGYLVGGLGSALPLPGGLGATGGMIGALALYGAPATAAAAAVLLYRGISLVWPLLLGAIAWGSSPAVRWPLRVDARRARLGSVLVHRPFARRDQRLPMALRTGTPALVGCRAIVLERIAKDERIGKVKIGSELWTARSFDDDAVICVGDVVEVVEVVAIHSATALVMP